MGRLAACVAVVLCHLLAAPSAEYLRIKQKIELILSGQAPAGASISLSPQEINAYAQGRPSELGLEGIRNTRVELGHGEATGTALVNFVKLRRSQGLETGWLLGKLLEGERPVLATVKVHGAAGRLRLDVERVAIGGIAIGGDALDFLIEKFVLPLYPDARIGAPVEMGYRIERIDVRPGGVNVLIGE